MQGRGDLALETSRKLAMRFDKAYPWVLRPVGVIVATAIMTAVSLWFLATWTSPDATNVGLAERVVATMQTGYLSLVILVCWFKGKRS